MAKIGEGLSTFSVGGSHFVCSGRFAIVIFQIEDIFSFFGILCVFCLRSCQSPFNLGKCVCVCVCAKGWRNSTPPLVFDSASIVHEIHVFFLLLLIHWKQTPPDWETSSIEKKDGMRGWNTHTECQVSCFSVLVNGNGNTTRREQSDSKVEKQLLKSVASNDFAFGWMRTLSVEWWKRSRWKVQLRWLTIWTGHWQPERCKCDG